MAATFHTADTVRRIALAAAAATLVASTVALAGETPKKPLTFGASPELARGKYLVSVMGCDDCHTPMKMGARGPEPDMALRLSGHPQALKVQGAPPVDGKSWVWAGNATNTAFAGPWGVSYAANLTSDATGIGSWTEANFVRAIKDGKHLGVGRPINPPMPWPAYRNATEDDLKAVYAYLKTVPPVKNVAPEYQPPQMAKK
ncbi:MAG: c-type cytochrome [Holophagales bacterium]|nr:c-type cytochrome [Holophagales bacterium]